MKLPWLKVVPSTTGRDRWLAGFGNSIHWAAYAPRWLSWRSLAGVALALLVVALAVPVAVLYVVARFVAGRGP